ncbi:hypothetical protein DFH06DRAFT_1238247 [Mycena polygramma]|nr:hypothetical protein DFH06DRAFT_1238247 [Mycena polygramma]
MLHALLTMTISALSLSRARCRTSILLFKSPHRVRDISDLGNDTTSPILERNPCLSAGTCRQRIICTAEPSAAGNLPTDDSS